MPPDFCPFCSSKDLESTETIGFRDTNGEYHVLNEYLCNDCGELFYTP